MGWSFDKLATLLLAQKALFAGVDIIVFDRVLSLAGRALRHGGHRIALATPQQNYHYYLGPPRVFAGTTARGASVKTDNRSSPDFCRGLEFDDFVAVKFASVLIASS